MRVLNVNTTLDPVNGGGMAERTYQMSRFLVKAGADCTVLVTDMGLTRERLDNLQGIDVLAYPCLLKRFYVPRGPYRRIWNLVERADVIHLMGHWSFLNTVVFLMAQRLGKPYVVCPAGALPVYGRSKVLKNIYNFVIGKKIIRQASGHIAIAPVEVEQFADYGVPPEKVSILPNGVDAENFLSRDTEAFRKKFDLGNVPFIMFMGRLNAIKGPDLLLEAFCRIKDAIRDYHLVFVGPDDGMLDPLQERVLAHHIMDRVHFLGHVSGDNKSQAYHAADLLVIPSRQEAMSIVVLEAGISGIPVLITDQCGFDQIAVVGGGQVVPATAEGLKEGLAEMLKDPEGLKASGKKLKEYVRTHYSWDIIARQYLDYFGLLVK